ncbi:MAG: lipoyl synthase [Nitrospirales bacterium]|nr:lipoyl synthase [Nitrospirales bacterium]
MTFIPTSQITRPTHKPDEIKAGRLPGWFRVNIQRGERYKAIRRIIDTHGLHTICEEARCPNQWECWNHGTATFLILGDICTRRCGYCSVTTGRPLPIDSDEPNRIGETVRMLGLRHAVITSVNRDELPDGGASIFAETIASIRRFIPSCTVEVLIPDFQGSWEALNTVMQASPDILNHNIETVGRLFPAIRPQGKYQRSLELLDRARVIKGRTKSGLMVGFGETWEEIRTVMQDLRKVGCQILTIGQYLRPTKTHSPVTRYYQPEEFDELKDEAETLGFAHVESGPLVRSSYHAEKQASLSNRSLKNKPA